MFLIARLTTAPAFFRRVSKDTMLTRSQLTSIKTNLLLKQDKTKNIFYADVGEYRAVIEYKQEGNVLKLMHTEVPKELEGRGIGKEIAKATFDYIAQRQLKAEVYCDFLKHFLDRYGQEYKKHVVT